MPGRWTAEILRLARDEGLDPTGTSRHPAGSEKPIMLPELPLLPSPDVRAGTRIRQAKVIRSIAEPINDNVLQH
jgi:hypothetical protein